MGREGVISLRDKLLMPLHADGADWAWTEDLASARCESGPHRTRRNTRDSWRNSGDSMECVVQHRCNLMQGETIRANGPHLSFLHMHSRSFGLPETNASCRYHMRFPSLIVADKHLAGT